VAIDFEISDEVPPLLIGDAGRLRQVLSNLVNNAVKFTNAGKVLIIATVPRSIVGVEVTLRVAVTDNGIGLDENNVARLFEPFTQADGSITRQYGGTGLGLAICKRLIDLMGGRIDASGRRGVGSTFWIEVDLPLPVVTDTAASKSTTTTGSTG
jgi:signal transduction histidine kinase